MTLKDVARVDRFKIFQQFVILASDRYDLEVRDAWNRKFGHSKTTEDAKTVEKKKFVSANDDLVDVALAVEYDTIMILMKKTRTVVMVMLVMMMVSDEVTEVARAAELRAGGALNKASTYFPLNASAV